MAEARVQNGARPDTTTFAGRAWKTLALAGLCCVAACAAPSESRSPGAATVPALKVGWTRLVQVDNRFAVYLEHPVQPLREGRATFRLVYVYQPGTIFWEQREVAWQEYVAMTVDCRAGTMRAGLRRRFGPDGAMVFSDEERAYAPIQPGAAVEAAADAVCRKTWPSPRVEVPAGPDWMREARRTLAVSPPVKPH